MDRIIGAVSQSIVACALPPFGDGNVGMDMGIFDGLDVLGSSIGHIARDLVGLTAPTEKYMPEEVKHGLIVHHLAWHHQDRHDDATLASIHDVVGVIAQMGSSPLQAHRRCIRIAGTDARNPPCVW